MKKIFGFEINTLDSYAEMLNGVFESFGIQILKMNVSQINDRFICLTTRDGEFSWHWYSIDEFFGIADIRSFFEVCDLMHKEYEAYASNNCNIYPQKNSIYPQKMCENDVRFLKIAKACSSFEELEVKMDLEFGQ